MNINKPQCFLIQTEPIMNFAIGDYLCCYNIPSELIEYWALNCEGSFIFTLYKRYEIIDSEGHNIIKFICDEGKKFSLYLNDHFWETSIKPEEIFKLIKK